MLKFQIHINSPSKGEHDCMSKEKQDMTQPLKPLKYINLKNKCFHDNCIEWSGLNLQLNIHQMVRENSDLQRSDYWKKHL